MTQTKQKEREKEKWYSIDFRKGKVKEKFLKEKGQFRVLLGNVMGSRDQKVNFFYSIFTIFAIIGTFIAYYYNIFDNVSAFIISSGLVIIRVIAFIVDKLSNEDVKEILRAEKKDPKLAVIIFIVEYAVFTWAFIMMFNLVYDFRMWNSIGLTNKWIYEISISINSIFASMMLIGILLIYKHRENFQKQRQKGQLSFAIWYVFFFIVIPAILIAVLIPTFIQVDTLIHDGVISNAEYSGERVHFYGQGIEDWFGYTFYIFFQAPLPAFMIAIMGFGAIAVILAQNQAQIGRNVAGVAVGIIAIIPMLIVLTAISGSIPPPQELIDVIGLSRPVASFIYGMGLILTYVIAISVMGVFIASSRALTSDWA